jgi:hypothetical protein
MESTSCAARALELGREKEAVARVFMWWRVGICVPLAPPFIFIEHANGLPRRRPTSTLMLLRSNPCRP